MLWKVGGNRKVLNVKDSNKYGDDLVGAVSTRKVLNAKDSNKYRDDLVGVVSTRKGLSITE